MTLRACFAFALLCACTKPDDVPALRAEAHATVAYYNGELDRLETRYHRLSDRGLHITAVLPGGDEMGRLVKHTIEGMFELQKRLAASAAQLDAARTAAELRRRTDAYRELAEDGLPAGSDHLAVPGIPRIGAVLTDAEGWVTHAEDEMSRAGSGSAMLGP